MKATCNWFANCFSNGSIEIGIGERVARRAANSLRTLRISVLVKFRRNRHVLTAQRPFGARSSFGERANERRNRQFTPYLISGCGINVTIKRNSNSLQRFRRPKQVANTLFYSRCDLIFNNLFCLSFQWLFSRVIACASGGYWFCLFLLQLLLVSLSPHFDFDFHFESSHFSSSASRRS